MECHQIGAIRIEPKLHQVTSCEATLPAGSINATLLLLLLSTAVRRSATDPHIAGRRRRHALLHGQGPAAGGDHLRPRSTVRCTGFLFFFLPGFLPFLSLCGLTDGSTTSVTLLQVHPHRLRRVHAQLLPQTLRHRRLFAHSTLVLSRRPPCGVHYAKQNKHAVLGWDPT